MSQSRADSVRRVRAFVSRYLAVVAVVLLVVAALGGFLTYTAYGQEQTRTERTTNTLTAWSSTGQFSHQATVENGTRAFPEGTIMRNRTVYYPQIAPVLNGSFVYGYTATDNGSLTVETSITLVIRSVADGEETNVTEYWRVEEQLSSGNGTLGPDQNLRVSFTENMSGVQQEIEQIEDDLGRIPGTVKTEFVARVDIDGNRNGQSVNQRRSYRLPVTVRANLYRVNGSDPQMFGGERTTVERTAVPVQPGPLRRYGGPLALAVGLLGLFGLGYARHTDRLDVSEAERAYLAYRQERAEFDEWITRAHVPADRVSSVDTHVETTSLAGLVDLAIDTENRVIEAADRECYYVLGDETLYSFEPPTPESSGDPLAPEAASEERADAGQEDVEEGETIDESEGADTEDSRDPVDFDQFLSGNGGDAGEEER